MTTDAAHLKTQMFKSARTMSLYIVIGIGLLLAVFEITKKDIAQAEQENLLQTFAEVLPTDAYNNAPLNDRIQFVSQPHFGTAKPVTIYRARKDNQPVAVILETIAPDGYNGDINLLIAIYHNGQIAGVRTLKHHETPGLGDKIELRKSKWILSFEGHSLEEDNLINWAVKKDDGMFDQFTAATITPRAVVKAIRNTLIFVQKQGDALYE